MLGTQLHWVKGPWRGRLAMAARPRGGEWLADEIDGWRNNGIQTVLSLLERNEEFDLNLDAERDEVEKQGLKFFSFPIADRDVPASLLELGKMLDTVRHELSAGKDVVVHCRQGVGRTGLVAACLLAANGLGPQQAMDLLTDARGVEVPETAAQRRWILNYAEALATAR